MRKGLLEELRQQAHRGWAQSTACPCCPLIAATLHPDGTARQPHRSPRHAGSSARHPCAPAAFRVGYCFKHLLQALFTLSTSSTCLAAAPPRYITTVD